MRKDVPVVPLTVHENLLLHELVPFLGIVIRLLKAGVGRGVMLIVLDHVVADIGEHLEHL